MCDCGRRAKLNMKKTILVVIKKGEFCMCKHLGHTAFAVEIFLTEGLCKHMIKNIISHLTYANKMWHTS